MGREKPIIAFPQKRFGTGTVPVYESDLELRTCPRCHGKKKVSKAEVGDPFRSHTEREWRCPLCSGIGSITCTERTLKDLREHYA